MLVTQTYIYPRCFTVKPFQAGIFSPLNIHITIFRKATKAIRLVLLFYLFIFFFKRAGVWE